MTQIRPELAHIYENHMTETEVMLQEENKVEYVLGITLEDSILIYYKGHPFPQKGLPEAEAVYACNIAKRVAILCMSPFLLLGWRRNKERFERAAGYSLSRWYLKPQYMTHTARELLKLPLGETARIVAHIFEYDSAYRHRLQDLADECDEVALRKRPVRELLRLWRIVMERDTDPWLRAKYRRLLPFIFLAFPFRRRFLDLIRDIDISRMRTDEIDRYWTRDKTSYRYRGTGNETYPFISSD